MIESNGGPGAIRTPDPQIRSLANPERFQNGSCRGDENTASDRMEQRRADAQEIDTVKSPRIVSWMKNFACWS